MKILGPTSSLFALVDRTSKKVSKNPKFVLGFKNLKTPKVLILIVIFEF